MDDPESPFGATLYFFVPTNKTDPTGQKGGRWYPLFPDMMNLYVCPLVWICFLLLLSEAEFRALDLAARASTRTVRDIFLFAASTAQRQQDHSIPITSAALGKLFNELQVLVFGESRSFTTHSPRQSVAYRIRCAGGSLLHMLLWGGWNSAEVKNYLSGSQENMRPIGKMLAGLPEVSAPVAEHPYRFMCPGLGASICPQHTDINRLMGFARGVVGCAAGAPCPPAGSDKRTLLKFAATHLWPPYVPPPAVPLPFLPRAGQAEAGAGAAAAAPSPSSSVAAGSSSSSSMQPGHGQGIAVEAVSPTAIIPPTGAGAPTAPAQAPSPGDNSDAAAGSAAEPGGSAGGGGSTSGLAVAMGVLGGVAAAVPALAAGLALPATLAAVGSSALAGVVTASAAGSGNGEPFHPMHGYGGLGGGLISSGFGPQLAAAGSSALGSILGMLHLTIKQSVERLHPEQRHAAAAHVEGLAAVLGAGAGAYEQAAAAGAAGVGQSITEPARAFAPLYRPVPSASTVVQHGGWQAVSALWHGQYREHQHGRLLPPLKDFRVSTAQWDWESAKGKQAFARHKAIVAYIQDGLDARRKRHGVSMAAQAAGEEATSSDAGAAASGGAGALPGGFMDVDAGSPSSPFSESHALKEIEEEMRFKWGLSVEACYRALRKRQSSKAARWAAGGGGSGEEDEEASRGAGEAAAEAAEEDEAVAAGGRRGKRGRKRHATAGAAAGAAAAVGPGIEGEEQEEGEDGNAQAASSAGSGSKKLRGAQLQGDAL